MLQHYIYFLCVFKRGCVCMCMYQYVCVYVCVCVCVCARNIVTFSFCIKQNHQQPCFKTCINVIRLLSSSLKERYDKLDRL